MKDMNKLYGTILLFINIVCQMLQAEQSRLAVESQNVAGVIWAIFVTILGIIGMMYSMKLIIE